MDGCTLEKEWLDYARVLITAPSLDVLNSYVILLIDGTQFTIQLVEEWGFTLGEDVFLSKDEPNSYSNNSEQYDEHVFLEDPEGVEKLFYDLHNDWEAHVAIENDKENDQAHDSFKVAASDTMNVEHVKDKENVKAHDSSEVAASATMNAKHVKDKGTV